MGTVTRRYSFSGRGIASAGTWLTFYSTGYPGLLEKCCVPSPTRCRLHRFQKLLSWHSSVDDVPTVKNAVEISRVNGQKHGRVVNVVVTGYRGMLCLASSS